MARHTATAPSGTVVAFQGELGAFGERAVRQLWGESAVPLPCRRFSDAVGAVAGGRAQAAVIPVENSIAGPVEEARRALDAHPALRVVGETTVHVRLALLGVPGAALDGVRVARSHAVALAQCASFLAAHPSIAVEPWYDTAGAASDVSCIADPTIAAIASPDAAERYGLVVLVDDITDRGDSETRFVAVASG